MKELLYPLMIASMVAVFLLIYAFLGWERPQITLTKDHLMYDDLVSCVEGGGRFRMYNIGDESFQSNCIKI